MFQPRNILKTLENLSGDKFKDNLIEILTESGYDTKSAIKSLDKSKISDIETFVNQNRDRFQNIFKKTKYEKSENFKFLPGHSALILTLPEYIAHLPAKSTATENRSRKRPHSEREDHPPSTAQQNTNQNNVNQSTSLINESDNGQNHTQRFQNADLAKIQQVLISKFNTFSTKKGFGLTLQVANVLNLRIEKDSIKCCVECPVCKKKIPCTYVTHWICSNLQAHLKSHFTFEEYTVGSHNVLQKMPRTSAENSNIIRAQSSNVALNQILNE